MSNQQWWLPATSQLHLFFTTQSLFRTSFSTLLAGGCPNVVILAQPPLLQRSGLKWDKWQAQLGRKFLAPCFCNFNSGTLASGKTRLAPKTKATFQRPLSMKCQITGLLNSPKTKMINGIMLVVFPCPFVQVALRRCHLEMTD